MSDCLDDLGERVAREQDRALARAALPSSEALLAGVQRRRRRAEVRARVVGAAVAATVVLVAVGLGASRTGPPAPPSPPRPLLGVTRAEAASVPLVFADGTKIVVGKGARAELKEIREHGAAVTLEDGVLAVDVVHTNASRWDIAAGPFGIHVTGTKFDATWEPRSGRLTVAMSEGAVVVSGPCVSERLAAPNTKVFSCDPPAVVPPAPVELPDSVAKAVEPRPEALPKWRADLRRGDFASADAAISARDLEALLAREPAESLMGLADAARLAGRTARAQRLYASVRERFPGTSHAGKSAFLLGRLAQGAGATDDALRWFDLAAREPGGFSQEALGRMTELEQNRGSRERARALAEEYLRRYPRGAYARYASSVVDVAVE